MRKIILLLVIVVTTMVSCSTDDTIMPNENTVQDSKGYEISNFNFVERDSMTRDLDTLIGSDPLKPKKND